MSAPTRSAAATGPADVDVVGALAEEVAVVLGAGAAWAASVLAGPVDGLLPRLLRRRAHLAG